MADTYHIKIKKDYAVAVIEDLQKMEAVELLPDIENEFHVPDWQTELGKEEVKKYYSSDISLKKMCLYVPGLLISLPVNALHPGPYFLQQKLHLRLMQVLRD